VSPEEKDIRTPVATNDGDWVKKFGEHWKAQCEALQTKFGASIERIRFPGDDTVEVPVVYAKKESIVAVLTYLRDEQGYNFLSDITATDEEGSPRFEVIYQLLSHEKKCRFRVKVRVDEGEAVPTVIGVWPAADWAEREVYDMFGVKFSGHPDLRRILMDERWEGHPLRKDYPLRGYQVFTEPEPIHESLLK